MKEFLLEYGISVIETVVSKIYEKGAVTGIAGFWKHLFPVKQTFFFVRLACDSLHRIACLFDDFF